MKKLLVLSDSHGNIDNMVFAVKKTAPDMIIHLGDCWSDAVGLAEEFPEIPMAHVPGNCDFSMEETEKILEIEGQRILICHGHTYNVKSNYLTLEYAAHEKNVTIALFGHTHKVFYDKHNGLLLMNPGSIGAPGWGTPPSYGILELDEEQGIVDMNILYIDKI